MEFIVARVSAKKKNILLVANKVKEVAGVKYAGEAQFISVNLLQEFTGKKGDLLDLPIKVKKSQKEVTMKDNKTMMLNNWEWQ